MLITYVHGLHKAAVLNCTKSKLDSAMTFRLWFVALILCLFERTSESEKFRSWLGPNNLIGGIFPQNRDNGYILTELNGYLFVFGGSSSSGEVLIRMRTLMKSI